MKKLMNVITMLVVIMLIFFISGHRFTALSAAKSNSSLSKDAELLGEYEIGSSVIFLFKSDKEQLYRTVLTQKSGVLFRSNASTYFPYSTDKLQTVGGMSFTSENTEFSFLSITSNDEDVAYIEAGVVPNVERKEINKDEQISFLFPFSMQIDFLHPTAYDKDGNKLYYYGYPKGSNVLKKEDFKWHKVE
ncbi:hypothetical protein V1503_24235 [Bacillus sp. SCS-151]|uniref:hypothetical protein n=1 Tax=Nanhaiella sioensis TaxID=3115293 RepID=UPI00397E1A55